MKPGQEQDDEALLRAYEQLGSEIAFRELVERHLGTVFGAALRRTGDRSLAEEVAQNVFTALAAKAGRLKPKPTLAGWLYRAAMLECSELMRKEQSHKRKVNAFSTQALIESEGKNVWREALPVLDEAIDALPAADRNLILLRFFDRQSFRQIGAALGNSEGAAQKQCARALEKLSDLLRRKGLAVPAATLASGLATEVACAVPAGFTVAISQGAVAGASAFSAKTWIIQPLEIMAQAKTKAVAAIMTTKITALSMVALGAAFPLSIQWAHSKRDSSREHAQSNQGKTIVQSHDPTRRATASGNPQPSGFDLEALAREFRRLPLPNGLFKRELQLELLMYSLSESQATQVVALLKNAPNAAALSRIATALFNRLAEFDPQAAAVMALELGELRYAAHGGVLATWAQRAPDAALSFLEEFVLSNHDTVEMIMSQGLLERVIRVTGDRRLVLERMEALSDTDLSKVMTKGLLAAWAKSEPDEAFSWVQSKEDYGLRNRYTQDLLHQLASPNPEKAFQLALSLDHPRLKEESVRWALMQWAGQGKPEAREAYLTLPDAVRTEDLTNNTAPFLAQDAQTAFEIANMLPEGYHRNQFLYHGVRRLTADAPEEAANHALAIPDEGTRMRALEYVGKQWLAADPAKARSWLERDGGLPAQNISDLLKGDSK